MTQAQANDAINRSLDVSRRGKRFIRDYGLELQDYLDEFCQGSGTRHTIQIDVSPEVAIVTIKFLRNDPYGEQIEPFVQETILQGYQALRAPQGPGVVMFRESPELNALCPGITMEMGQPIQICRSADARHWTNVQAWIDSSDIIACILSLPREESC